jgi:hypothetical protein
MELKMKRIFITMFLLLPLVFFAQDTSSKNDLLIYKLKKIEDKYFSYLSFNERRDAIELMDEIIELIESGDIDSSVVISKSKILSDESFAILLDNVSKEINGSSQVRMILSIGKNGYIKCSQLKQLVKLISFDKYKIELIKKIYSNIYDPVNLISVTSLIDSSISRDELETWLISR